MSPTRTIVFLGPSLPVAEARALLPATYHPPAAMGDIYRAARRLARRGGPARLVLVDGYFERMAAPWHKEILWALERGLAVYGAASMGALRAAELERYGMVGVGAVFRDFRAGRLTDDDEVAVVHGPGDHGYPRMSEAMVDLRAGLAAAQRAGVLGARSHDRLIALAKATFYRERSWEALLDAGRDAGLPARQLDALAARIARARPSVKASDTRTLLRQLARTAAPPRRPPPWRLERTWFWRRFLEVVDGELG